MSGFHRFRLKEVGGSKRAFESGGLNVRVNQIATVMASLANECRFVTASVA